MLGRTGAHVAYVCLIAVLSFACGGKVNADSRNGTAGTGGDSCDSGAGTGGASGAGGASGGGASGAGGDASPPEPQPIPSVHEVRFIVTNQGTTDRLVVIRGFNCTTFGIEREQVGSWQSVPIALVSGMTGNCAGNDYERPRVHQLARLEPGMSTELSWDGREVVMYEGDRTCFADPGVYGALQPVAAGKYRVEVGIEDEPPEPTCVEEGGVVDCGYGWFTTKLPVPLERCGTSESVLTEFDLPVGGEVVVQVDLQ